MSDREIQATIHARAASAGLIALCDLLRKRGVLDNTELAIVREAVLDDIEHSEHPPHAKREALSDLVRAFAWQVD